MKHEPISAITKMLVNQEISGDAAVKFNFIQNTLKLLLHH